MTARGRVRVWHDGEGWGVIDSPATPGGCWAHVAAVLVAGARALRTAQDVEFSFEAVEQDGYAFRAVEVWPAGLRPVHADDLEVSGPSAGYRTLLTLTFDDDETDRS